MLKFNICGLNICVTFGFLFTVSILILTDSPSVRLSAVTACIIHELGHCLTAVILSVKLNSLKLWAGGANIELKSKIISYKKELAVLISGPAFNLLFSAVYMLEGMRDTANIHLMLGFFNLLPFSSLDGGGIIRDFFNYNEKNGLLIQKTAAVLLGVFIILLSFLCFPENILIQATIIILIADELT